MPQLSDSQLVVLTAACQRPDRFVFPVTTRLKGNAAGNVLKSLLNKGLIKEVRAKRDDTVWRHDEERGRMTLVATKAAFAALGIDPQEALAEDETENAGDTRRLTENSEQAQVARPTHRCASQPRRQQASATHRHAAPGKGSDHRRDRPGRWSGSRTRCGAQSQAR